MPKVIPEGGAPEAIATLKRLRSSGEGTVRQELDSLFYKVRHTHPDQGDARSDVSIALQKLRGGLTRRAANSARQYW